MTRLGFVGVGRWAQKLRAAFEAEGAVAYGYTRQGSGSADEFGPLSFKLWQTMVDDPRLDALVLCAPPDVTTECAIACAAAGKPVMATKPLMLTEAVPIRAPFYVDFWRLWSSGAEPNHFMPTECGFYVNFYGSGPDRGFSGLLDYGPHAFAMLRRCMGEPTIEQVQSDAPGQWDIRGHAGGRPFRIQTGNGYDSQAREWGWAHSDRPSMISWREDSESIAHIGKSEDKGALIRRMCRSFLNDISEGFVSTAPLQLSCAVMRDLAEVRRLAEKGKAA